MRAIDSDGNCIMKQHQQHGIPCLKGSGSKNEW
jgi:hypothetical protein